MDAQFTTAQRAARHSMQAHSLLTTERNLRQARRDLHMLNWFDRGAFDDEIERLNLMIKRLGARRRRMMKKPGDRNNAQG